MKGFPQHNMRNICTKRLEKEEEGDFHGFLSIIISLCTINLKFSFIDKRSVTSNFQSTGYLHYALLQAWTNHLLDPFVEGAMMLATDL